MGWATDVRLTMEQLAAECTRCREAERVANETIDRLTARIATLESILDEAMTWLRAIQAKLVRDRERPS